MITAIRLVLCGSSVYVQKKSCCLSSFFEATSVTVAVDDILLIV